MTKMKIALVDSFSISLCRSNILPMGTAARPPMLHRRLRQTLLLLVKALCLGVLVTPTAHCADAESSPSPALMQFNPVPPLQPVAIFGGRWSIYASGVIDTGAPLRLASLLAANEIPDESQIFLNSPGGNLLAGIELGRLIRKHRLQTLVGAQGKEIIWRPANGIGGKRFEPEPGLCLSACALSFLGGSFRFMSHGAYGVHRFYSASAGGLDSDAAQIVSAAVLQYIRDMGVDAALFTEMTQAGKDEMKIIPEGRLVELGVVNNGTSALSRSHCGV
jgi:hypothetical protein